MPYITIEGGRMTREQKAELIEKMTKTASEIMHVPTDYFIVTVKELDDENIGIGGRTIDIIKSEYMKNKS